MLAGACATQTDVVDPASLSPTLLRPFVADCRATAPQEVESDLMMFAACGDSISQPTFPVAMDEPRGEAKDQLDRALTQLVRGTSIDQREVGLYSGFDWLDPEVRAELSVESAVTGTGEVSVAITRAGDPYVPSFFMIDTTTWAAFVLPMTATVFQFDEATTFTSDYCFTQDLDTPITGCEISRSLYTQTALNFGADPSCLPLKLWSDESCALEG